MKYLIRYTVLSILALCCINYTYAQHVSETDAMRIAKVFYGDANEKDSSSGSKENYADYKLTSLGGETPTMYKINTPQGWVIVSADQRVRPILAYSNSPDMADDTIFIYDNVLLAWYHEQIAYIRDSSTNEETHPEWLSYRTSSELPNRDVEVLPLLVKNNHAIAWRQAGNQNGYQADCDKTYNKYFPAGNNGDGICHKYVVGCGSLSAAEVMWYWQWPKSAIVRDENGNYLYRVYNWDNIPYVLSNSTPQSEADMTATLLHDVAMADSARYDQNGTSTHIENVLAAINTCFGFDGVLVDRENYTNNQWKNLLKNELNNGRPVLYGGCVTLYSLLGPPIYINECHQFVIDGYESANYFHIVYSQDEHTDGYYTLNLVNPDGTNTNVYYNGGHRAIIGIQPQKICSPTTISTNEFWPEWFNKVYVEGVTISNKVIPSGSKGVITSKQYIILESGFTIEQGAIVQISINDDLSCDELNRNETNRRTVNALHEMYDDKVEIFEISPNPVKDILNIHVSEELSHVNIYNLNGQCVMQTAQTDVDVSALPQGMYILRAETTDGTPLQAKFIKQ